MRLAGPCFDKALCFLFQTVFDVFSHLSDELLVCPFHCNHRTANFLCWACGTWCCQRWSDFGKDADLVEEWNRHDHSLNGLRVAEAAIPQQLLLRVKLMLLNLRGSQHGNLGLQRRQT